MLKKQIKSVKLNQQNYIDIPYDKIDTLSSEILEVKSQLKHLYLSGNNLETVEEVGQLTNLRELYLSLNKLSSMPKMQGLTVLTHLNLSFNRLEVFPTGLTSCGNLRYLDLSGNRLKELSPKIGYLTALRSLYVSDNMFTEIPKEIGQLILLEILVIRNNEISLVPSELGKLTLLKRLYAQQNQIQFLPIEAASCSLDKSDSVVRLTKNPLTLTLQKTYDTKGVKGIFELYRSGKFSQIMSEVAASNEKKYFFIINLDSRARLMIRKY